MEGRMPNKNDVYLKLLKAALFTAVVVGIIGATWLLNGYAGVAVVILVIVFRWANRSIRNASAVEVAASPRFDVWNALVVTAASGALLYIFLRDVISHSS
jgi:uncharacterized membrane protein